MDVVIESALVTDLPKILALQKQCYISEAQLYNDYSMQPLTQTIDSVELEWNKGIVLKAIVHNQIVGSIRAFHNQNTCYVGKLIVDPNFQNNGIGFQLLREIENYFPSINRFELFTGFQSEKNIYLYQKIGYKVFKQEKISETFSFVYLEKFK